MPPELDDNGLPRVTITRVEYKKPETKPFVVAPQESFLTITTDVRSEPDVSINAGDVVPLLPNLFVKVLTMKDWKTTLAGIAGGALVAFGDYVTSSNGSITLKGAAAAIGLALLGWLAGDSKK